GGRKVCRGCARHAMVRSDRPHLAESGPTLPMRLDQPLPAGRILPRYLGKPYDVFAKTGHIRIRYVVRPVSSADTTDQTLLLQSAVMRKRIQRKFGGGDHLHIGPVEHGKRKKIGIGKALVDKIV